MAAFAADFSVALMGLFLFAASVVEGLGAGLAALAVALFFAVMQFLDR